MSYSPREYVAEARAADALRRADGDALRRLLEELRGAAPPAPSPEAGRSSTAELRALLQAGAGLPWQPAEGARGGYLVTRPEDGDTPVVRPAFAEALAASLAGRELRRLFPDLWAIDLAVWEALDDAPSRIAALWLESPGRRLLQDLRVLPALPSTAPLGATCRSIDRIERAAGVEDAPAPSDRSAFQGWARARPAAWRALHLSTPGWPMALWAPASDDVPGALEALFLAEEGSPASACGAALGWLLHRLRDRPIYEIGDIARDLRDDLPARLAEAFDAQTRTAARAPAALEQVTLQHAARLTPKDNVPGRVFRAWCVARWIAACTWRSPFFGGDEPTLVARLQALLPRVLPDSRDALDPVGLGEDGLDVREVALVSGALSFPARAGGVVVVPPSPLARKLREIAARADLRPAETQAEDQLSRGQNELGWTAPHVAPPLAARFWLTDRQIRWLASIPVGAQIQAIELAARHPERFGWMGLALMEEGAALAPAARTIALEAWRAQRFATVSKVHERCAFGIGLCDGLDTASVRDLFDLCSKAEGTWPAFLLDAAAKSTSSPATWEQAIRRLLDLAEQKDKADTLRLNAALFVAWRTTGRKGVPQDISDRLTALSGQPPFVRHAGLARELRRRGVTRCKKGVV